MTVGDRVGGGRLTPRPLANTISIDYEKKLKMVGKLVNAARDGNFDEVRRLLKKGNDVNEVDEYGGTALIYAISAKNEQVVQFLVQNGADVNFQDQENRTPLFYSVFWMCPISLVKLILENGADKNIRDIQGNTPLMMAQIQQLKIGIQRDDVIALLTNWKQMFLSSTPKGLEQSVLFHDVKVHNKNEIQLLCKEVNSILRIIQKYKSKTFRMQINPMIHTKEILEYLEQNFKEISEFLPSVINREEANFLFDEVTERHIFDHIYWVRSYLDITGKKELEDYQKEYLAFKASLPTRDLEDLQAILHFTKIALKELSERTDG